MMALERLVTRFCASYSPHPFKLTYLTFKTVYGANCQNKRFYYKVAPMSYHVFNLQPFILCIIIIYLYINMPCIYAT